MEKNAVGKQLQQRFLPSINLKISQSIFQVWKISNSHRDHRLRKAFIHEEGKFNGLSVKTRIKFTDEHTGLWGSRYEKIRNLKQQAQKYKNVL